MCVHQTYLLACQGFGARGDDGGDTLDAFDRGIMDEPRECQQEHRVDQQQPEELSRQTTADLDRNIFDIFGDRH